MTPSVTDVCYPFTMPIAVHTFSYADSGALDRLLAPWVAEAIERGRPFRFDDRIVLVPSSRAGRFVRGRIAVHVARAAQDQSAAFLPPPTWTFRCLVREILRPEEVPVVEELEEGVLLGGLLNEMGDLPVLEPLRGPDGSFSTGLVSHILKFFREIRDYDAPLPLTPRVDAIRNHLGLVRETAEALDAVLDRYVGLLDRLNVWDEAGLRYRALERLAGPGNDAPAFLDNVREIAAWGFEDMGARERDILHRLAERVPVTAHVPFVPACGGYASSGRLARQLGGTESPEDACAEPSLDAFMFNRATPEERSALAGRIVFTHTITLTPVPSPEAEVTAIARIVKQGAMDGEIPDLSRVLVTFFGSDRYIPLVEEIFPRYGIPANIAPGKRAPRVPPIQAVMALLDAAIEASPAAVARLLSTPYLSFLSAEAHSVLLSLSRTNPPAASREEWLTLLDETLSAREIERTNEENASGEPPRGKDEEIRRSVSTLFDRLDRIAGASGWEEGRQALWEALAAGGFRGNLKTEEDRQGARRFFEIWLRLESAANAVSKIGGQTGPPGLREIADHLRRTLGGEAVRVAGDGAAAVQVLDPMEARGIDFDLVCVGGLTIDGLPGNAPTNIFFGGWVREQLGLPSARQRVEARRQDFLRLLHAGRRACHLVYPLEVNNRPVERSPFLSELDELVEIGRIVSVPPKEAGPPLSKEEWDQAAFGAGTLPAGAAPEADDLPEIAESFQAATDQGAGIRGGTPGYGGNLTGTPAAPVIRNRFADRTFSVSEIESCLECGYRYFLLKVLGLPAPLPGPDQAEAILRGKAYHEILAAFYGEWKRPIAEGEKDAAFARMAEIAKGVFAREGLDVEAKRALAYDGVLSSWIDAEAEGGWPAEEVLSEQTVEGTLASENGAARFRARIDRIDRTGSDAAILDYKTGSRLPTQTSVREGRSLQLPLYALLLERNSKGTRVARMGYASVRPKPKAGITPILLRESGKTADRPAARTKAWAADEEFDAVLNLAAGRAVDVVRAVRDGFFPRSDDPRACKTCGLSDVCRNHLLSEDTDDAPNGGENQDGG